MSENAKGMDSMILAGIPIAIIYWVLDSILNIFFSNRFNIVAEIFGPDLYEIYTRTIVLCILLIFGAHAQTTINKLKKARDALQKSEDDHREFIENLTAGVFRCTIDPAGHLVRANSAAARVFGYRSGEDLMSAKISDLYLHPSEMKEFIAELINRGHVSGMEIMMRKRSGKPFWASCSAAVKTDEFGHIAWIDGVIEDITSRKQAEDSLRTSEERYRQLVDYAPAGIYEVDLRTGRFLRANDLICELTGYSRTELLSMKSYEIFTEDSRSRFFERLTKLYRGKELSESAEFKIRGKDGKIFWAVINDRKHYEFGKLKSATVVVHDVSELKRAEQEKRLLEYRLYRAQKMEAVGTLAGGIAHDFNNILMGIQGHVSIMLSISDYVHPYFNHLLSIENYINNANELTNKLLGFAKGGSSGMEVSDLNEITQDQVQAFEKTRKDVRVHTTYEENVWPIEVDPVKIKQVIMNLVVNALHAMPKGGDLYIRTQNLIMDNNVLKNLEYTPGKYVKVSIMDTGIGMDKATMQRVFEPFFTTKKMGPQKGTGLGLASAYGIVKSHKGFITVQSTEGKGANFSVFLPALKSRPEDHKQRRRVEPSRKETVLTVGDDSAVLDVLEQMLKKLGYSVLKADSGYRALDIFRLNLDKICLVIIDADIPQAVSSKILSNLSLFGPEVKFMMTGNQLPDPIKKEYLSDETGGFLKKPFSMMQLSGSLTEVMGA
jgi:PAS domain S-box-containing protein